MEFLTDYPVSLLQDAPVDDWEDDNGVVWEDVYYPAFYAQLERYYFKKYCDEIGIHRVSPHSFRHMRITHLVHSDDHDKDWVQRRAGHEDGKTTDLYTQTVFDRRPQPLEDYLNENDIDLLEVLDDE